MFPNAVYAMSDVPIPTYRDFMYPTLNAVQNLGGSAAISELDDLVLSDAAVTEEQLAVEYPEDASSSGSKVVHRLRWARTYLKAIGALDNSTRGIWSMNSLGLEPSPRVRSMVTRRFETLTTRFEPSGGRREQNVLQMMLRRRTTRGRSIASVRSLGMKCFLRN